MYRAVLTILLFACGFDRLQRHGYATAIFASTPCFDEKAGASTTSGCTGFIARKGSISGAKGHGDA